MALPYKPEYKVLIDGEALPAGLLASISNINYQDGIEGADRVEVTFANQNLKWLDHPLLRVDKGLKLKIGYALGEPLEEVFVGEITGVEPSFPNSGMPTLKITAMDFLQRLTRGKGDRAFFVKTPLNNFPIPDVIIASLVSATNLLIPYPDPIGGALSLLLGLAVYILDPATAQKGIRKQESSSDFEFLSKISKANGWDMSIDHTMEPHGYWLRFRSLFQDYSPSLTLTYGKSLQEFTPKITTVGDVSGIAARVWVSSIKMEFVIVVGWDFDRGAFTLKVYPGIGELSAVVPEPSPSLKTVYSKPVSFAQAGLKILGELLPRLNSRQTGSGSTVGDPRIKSGLVINLEGLGDEFGGLYRVTNATHTFGSSGYKTSFQARKEVWFGGLATPHSVAGAFNIQGQSLG